MNSTRLDLAETMSATELGYMERQGMADNSGAVRAFWLEGGPLVVFSQLGRATVGELELAIIDAVNEVVALAEGGDMPSPSFDGAGGSTAQLAAQETAHTPVRAVR